MSTTRLSSKGQVIIPRSSQSASLGTGQELVAIDTEDGVLLRPASAFPVTTLREVAACLPFTGKAKTLEDMEAAIKAGAKKKA